MSYLFHITRWPYAGDAALSPPSLSGEGFVHLCSAPQLLSAAERWFSDDDAVGILVLDPAELGAALRWEDLYRHGEAFPHLYSAVPSWAVAAVVKLERDPSGSFRWPGALRGARSPLLEGPDAGEALIEPRVRFPQEVLPPVAVLNYLPGVDESLRSQPAVQNLGRLGSAIGPPHVLALQHAGQSVAVCSPAAGGALAAVALEEMIALGCRRFVMCGGAGSLHQEQGLGQIVLPSDAWRDEGLSHHYLDPGPSVAVNAAALASAAAVLNRLGVSYRTGKTGTTDALYSETPTRVARRKEQGCLTVEMEAASLLAVAQYRGVPLVPILYCGDDLSGEQWDFRQWTSAHTVQEKTFWLAVEVALQLPE